MLFYEKRRKKKCPICGEMFFNNERTFIKLDDEVAAIQKCSFGEGSTDIEGLCSKCLMAAVYGAYGMRFNAFPKILKKGKRRMLAAKKVEDYRRW